MSAQSTQDMGGNFLRLGYDFYEEVMPQVSGNAFKVALVIYRETVGWKKGTAAVSYTYLEKRTGISRSTLERVIKELLKKGIIQLCSAVGRWGMCMYALAQRFNPFTDASESMVKTTTVQSPLMGSMVKVNTELWSKQPQSYVQDDHTTSIEMTIEPLNQPRQEEAPDEPKETLKEKERNSKEKGGSGRAENEIKIEEEKEEQEDLSQPVLRAPEWETVLEKIEPQVSKASFMTWFKGTRAYKRGDQFIIEVESSFQKRYLHRYGGLIRNLLEPLLPASMDVFILTADERSSA